jgi:hypothetical protein
MICSTLAPCGGKAFHRSFPQELREKDPVGLLVRRGFLSLASALAVPGLGFAQSAPGPITPAGQKLATALDAMNVEQLWQRNHRINWHTGIAHGPPETTPGGHTHCSAFAAAAAERLGIYLLRPPEHGQMWLANAQERWLNGAPEPGESAEQVGWHRLGRLADPGIAVQAVTLANQGKLVIAVYFQPPRMTPLGPRQRAGHVVIVRPSDKPVALIEENGPSVIQAGMRNYNDVPMRIAFAYHKAAWTTGAIEFFWHDTSL